MTDAAYLRQQAERCRRLAATCSHDSTSRSLRLMAEDFSKKALETEVPEQASFLLLKTRQA